MRLQITLPVFSLAGLAMVVSEYLTFSTLQEPNASNNDELFDKLVKLKDLS
jgi:hypothetical protein